MTTDSVWVCWWTNYTVSNGLVEWGLQSATSFAWQTAAEVTIFNYQTAFADPPMVRCEALLDNLNAETRYYYRASADGVSMGDVHSFTTFSATSTKFRFAVAADTTMDWTEYISRWPYVAGQIMEDDPSFYLVVGDIVDSGPVIRQYEKFFSEQTDLCKDYCLWPVLGNHEWTDYVDEGWANHKPQLYLDIFHLPENGWDEYYYSFDYGNAHFTILENNGLELDKDHGQWNWFVNDVSSTDREWKFVFFHIPGWSSGGTYSATVINDVCPILEEHGVDIVFSGHIHEYERSLKDGVCHIITGGGGSRLNDRTGEITDWTIFTRMTHEHMLVEIDGHELNCWAIDTDSVVFDQFQIFHTTPSPAPSPTHAPTGSPTAVPSSTPSATPTPSTTPTARKTPTPSVTPSSSATPTAVPSSTPSSTPAPSATPTVAVTPVPVLERLVLDGQDYDGDGSDDIGVFRAEQRLWLLRDITRVYFGRPGDLPASGDYNGDGTTDLALRRPSTGMWRIRGITARYLGIDSDLPVPGDYDGDGTTDVAVFRSKNGLWFIADISRIYWGEEGDLPVSADYNGDGTADPAVFSPPEGLWLIRNITGAFFGKDGDIPLPGDYDGDGTAEPAILRRTNGLWVLKGVTRRYFSREGDVPVPAYYGGAAKTLGIFRPSAGLWNLPGFTRVYYGHEDDIPLSGN
ncbi:MAG TPA: metallophosphoesterase [bacterium]|nr:metallophosphoesterase [bacterium]HPQ65613.1 metallophosphoesterase [bacterium]